LSLGCTFSSIEMRVTGPNAGPSCPAVQWGRRVLTMHWLGPDTAAPAVGVRG
jgi:hypothetical protein